MRSATLEQRHRLVRRLNELTPDLSVDAREERPDARGDRVLRGRQRGGVGGRRGAHPREHVGRKGDEGDEVARRDERGEPPACEVEQRRGERAEREVAAH